MSKSDLGWCLPWATVMRMEMIYSGALTIALLNHWHTDGAYWSSNRFLSSLWQIRALRSQLIACPCWLCGCCFFEKADPVGILDSILFLSPQVSSSLSCELSLPLPNLFTFSSDSVSGPMYNTFSCVHMHLWVCKRGIVLDGSYWPSLDEQTLWALNWIAGLENREAYSPLLGRSWKITPILEETIFFYFSPRVYGVDPNDKWRV